MSTVFVEKQNCEYLPVVNPTGALVEIGQFIVTAGGICGVAMEAAAIGAVLTLHVEEGIVLQADEFVAGEGTFGTANALVYQDPVSGDFSDTETEGYLIVGQVVEVLAGGVIRFAKFFRAITVPTFMGLFDVAGTPTNNDTLRYVTATGKWTVVPVAD
jgi:hypothetical protein